MNWIHNAHLGEVATLPSFVAPFSLYILTQSGGCPWDSNPKRFPVRLGTKKEIGERFGASRSTLHRHWKTVERLFEEVSPGRFLPRVEKWQNPSNFQTKEGKPVYSRISPVAVENLCEIFRKEKAKTALSAFRLACSLLPRLRAAQSAGRSFVVWTSEQVEESLKMGRRTISAAWNMLARFGLITRIQWRYRKISTCSGLLSIIPSTEIKAKRQTCQIETTNVSDRNTHSFGMINEFKNASSRVREDGACLDKPRITISKRFQDIEFADGSKIFPDLNEKGSLELAGFCSHVDDVETWVRSEILSLTDGEILNRSGLLLHLAKDQNSRPGLPSTWEKQRRRKMTRGIEIIDGTQSPWDRRSETMLTGKLEVVETKQKKLSRKEIETMQEKEAQAAYDEAWDLAETAETLKQWKTVEKSSMWSMNMCGAWGFADLESKSFQLAMKAKEAIVEIKDQEESNKIGLNLGKENWIHEDNSKNRMENLLASLTKSLGE